MKRARGGELIFAAAFNTNKKISLTEYLCEIFELD